MEMWVRDGAVVARPVKIDGTSYPDKALLDQFNMVKVESSESGSLVQWNMGCANWAALLFSVNLISVCPGPVRIKYFNGGWFDEKVPSASAAAARIESLIFKSDVRFSSRAYTTEVDMRRSDMPNLLRAVLESGDASDDSSITCTVDAEQGISSVERVGQNSLMANIWGVSPNTFPCLTGHSYDRTVTPQYFEVARTGRPHYDHVLASLVRPDGELQWMGYHRIIVPELKSGNQKVKIVSAFAPVDIELL
jgi:hypothetical protein